MAMGSSRKRMKKATWICAGAVVVMLAVAGLWPWQQRAVGDDATTAVARAAAGAAVAALGRIGGDEARSALRSAVETEDDTAVRREIELCLADAQATANTIICRTVMGYSHPLHPVDPNKYGPDRRRLLLTPGRNDHRG